MYRQCLAIEKKALGEDHPSVATTLWNMAKLHTQQGQIEQAKALYEENLRINRIVFGPDHQECKDTEEALSALQ